MKSSVRVGVIGAAIALAGCAGVQSALDPAGDQAAHFQDIWRLMLWVCGGMYALVMLFLGASLWRARRSLSGPPISDDEATPGYRPLRRVLNGWVALIVVGLLVLTGGSFLVDRKLAMASTDNALRIKVTGAQWWWRVEYEDPVAANRITTANELRLPVGRPAIIELQAEDVIHSFWIPNLGGKEDLIPGRTTRVVFNPRREGLYRGQCAEFCGLEHAKMALDVRVDSAGGFENWRQRQRQPAPPPATPQQIQGQRVFLQGACAACHNIGGTDAGGQTGPDLTHLASRRSLAAGTLPTDRESLTAWLHDPQSIKPGNHMPQVPMSATDRQALVAYLETLT